MIQPNDLPAQKRPRILIVDDTRENRDIAESVLAGVECELLMAQDGVTALAVAEHRLPDLILCDVMMPGMTGYEVVTRLRASPATQDIPIIICTSLSDANSRGHALSVGADVVLEKPLSRAVLLPHVQSLLANGRNALGDD